MTTPIFDYISKKTGKKYRYDIPLSLLSTNQLCDIAGNLGISYPNYTNIFGWTTHQAVLAAIMEKIPKELQSVDVKKPNMSQFLGKNVLTDYNYRSGWYAIRVITPHELDVANYIWDISQKYPILSIPDRVIQEVDKKTGKIVDKQTVVHVPLRHIIDVAYPLSFSTSKFRNVEKYRGYIFVKLHLDDCKNTKEKALLIEYFRKFLLTIQKVVSFVGFSVEDDVITSETVTSFASGKQKINTYKKHIILPSLAKEKELQHLENSHNNFSMTRKPDFSPGFVCNYVTVTGKWRKVVVTAVKDNSTFMVRYLKTDMPAFPVSRDRLFTKMEKKLANLAN
jgi:transcription antitermination factor NusG